MRARRTCFAPTTPRSLSEAGWFDLCGQEAEDAGVPMLVDACCAGGGIVLEGAQAPLDRAPDSPAPTGDSRLGAPRPRRLGRPARGGGRPRRGRGEPARPDHRDGRLRGRDVVRAPRAEGRGRRPVRHVRPARRRQDPAPSSVSPTTPNRSAAALVADTTECPLSKLNRVLGTGERTSRHHVARPSSVVALCRDELLERALGPANDAYTVKPSNEDATLAVWRAGQASPAEPDSRPKAPEERAPRTPRS
ncbi:MAG: hypothetical protein ACLTSX_12760 [Collinsella sp.]